MRPERPLVADRIAARHCKELLGAEPTLAELVPALSLTGERLARALGPAFARLTGGDAPVVRVGMPMDTSLGAIQAELDGLAAHSLFGIGPAALPLLATIEAAALLRLVDRAFGGPGTAPDTLPDTLPMSAELMLGRIDQALAEAVSQALGGKEAARARPRRHETSLRQLDPFPKNEELLQLSIEVEEEGRAPWSFSLAFPTATLAALRAGAQRARPSPGSIAPRGAEHEPFASMGIELAAVLIDLTLPCSRLARLQPGDVLPIAIPRSVPLTAGGCTFATGTIGDLDHRVALQIDHAF